MKPSMRRIFWISIGLVLLAFVVAIVANLLDRSVGIVEVFALPEVLILAAVSGCIALVALIEKIKRICFRAARRLTRQ